MYTGYVKPAGLAFRFFIVLIVYVSFPTWIYSQDIDMDGVYARDEFRWGVRSFNSTLFNKAIISFEKSLSYKPEDPRTREWLGRAYYRSGFVDAALRIWQNIIDEGKASSLLANLTEVVSARRGLGRELAEKMHYVISLEIMGKQEEFNLFTRPTSVRTRYDGSFYIVAYGSNEVLLFNANGALRKRLRGGFDVFDHPFDVADSGEGYLFVSEFEGNRIAKCNYEGYITGSIGERGRGEGQLLGPQYMAVDGKGYLFVTDWGNRRVSKFDYDGTFILDFGERSRDYDGFLAPSGILVYQDRVFVSDSVRKHIAVFDMHGNFITVLGEGRLNGPEGLSLFSDNNILIADTTRLVSLDIESGTVQVVSDIEGGAGRIMKADTDINGNLIAVDFDKNGITFLSEISSIYSGLFVQIDSIYAGNFPEVTVAVKVEDRLGNPISGLDSSNFLITERGYSVFDSRFEYSTDNSGFADVAILMDRSPEMNRYREQVKEVILQLDQDIRARGSIAMISGGETPLITAEPNSSRNDLLEAALSSSDNSDFWSFDLGARLSVTELLTSKNKRAVIFLTAQGPSEENFAQYDLIQLQQFMKNNGVAFYCIYLGGAGTGASENVEYLCEETGGRSYHYYEPAGIGSIIRDILLQRTGLYVFKFFSTQQTDFGRAYLPVEVEVILMKRSGRDELGYFAPLVF